MSISESELEQLKAAAASLEAQDGTRNTLYDQLDNIYLLKAVDLPTADWIKPTIAPDGRNAVNGAVRLLCGADPVFKVPRETNPPKINKMSDKLERAARSLWEQSGRVSNRPAHYDIALSGVHYSEIHILLHSTKDIVELADGAGSKAHAQRQAAKTPVIFEAVNPRDGHAQWGPTGMTAYYAKRLLKMSAVRARFGKAVTSNTIDTMEIEVHDLWTLDWHVCWSGDQDTPYVAAPNKDGRIPVVAVICEGSWLFNKAGQDNRQGFLYTILKSNLWQRKNLYLTVMNSLVFAIGSNPVLVHETLDEDSQLDINYDNPGGIVKIKPGEKLYALLTKIIDPQMLEQMGIVDRLIEESTMYKTATGQSLGGNAPFSMVSLLSQAGRLPLVVYQRMISMAIGLAVREAFEIMRTEGGSIKASGKNGLQEIKGKQIPEEFDIRADLEIALPQDDRMNVTIAAEAVKSGLESKRYARENHLKIGQSQDMDDEILEEKFADLTAEAELQKAMLQIQQEIQAIQQQMAMAQQQQGGMGGGPGGGAGGMVPPGGPPEQIPPEMQGGPPMDMGDPGAQPGAQPGLPMMGAGQPMGSPMGPGGMPPEDEGMMPPEEMM